VEGKGERVFSDHFSRTRSSMVEQEMKREGRGGKKKKKSLHTLILYYFSGSGANRKKERKRKKGKGKRGGESPLFYHLPSSSKLEANEKNRKEKKGEGKRREILFYPSFISLSILSQSLS